VVLLPIGAPTRTRTHSARTLSHTDPPTRRHLPRYPLIRSLLTDDLTHGPTATANNRRSYFEAPLEAQVSLLFPFGVAGIICAQLLPRAPLEPTKRSSSNKLELQEQQREQQQREQQQQQQRQQQHKQQQQQQQEEAEEHHQHRGMGATVGASDSQGTSNLEAVVVDR
jgi:hypothetical protein